MDLVVQELSTFLDQKFTSSINASITAIRPRLYLEGSPTGGVQLEIRDSAGTSLIATSNENLFSSMKTLQYAHKRYRFDVGFPVVSGVEYTVRLIGTSGYTFGANDFVGWCQDFDFRIYPVSGSVTPGTGTSSPFEMELWESKDVLRF